MSDSEGDFRPKKGPSAFAAAALLGSDSDSDSDGDSSPVVESKAEVAKPKVEEAPKPAAKAAAAKGKGKKGGKAGKGAADDDDDLDALLSELGAAPAAVATGGAAADKKDAAADKKDDGKTVDAAAAYLASMGLGDEGAGGAAKDKKKKKKKDAKKGGAGDAADGSDDEAAPAEGGAAAGGAGAAAPAAAAAGGGKKLSAAARAAQERLAAVEREAQRKAKEDEERKKREDELKAQEEEEERKKRERREREKRREKERKEREKAEGTYMTAKQKAALDRARARLGVNPSAAALAAAVAAEGGDDSGSEGEGASPDAAAAAAKKDKVKTAAMYASGGKKKPAAAAAAAAAAPTAADAAAGGAGEAAVAASAAPAAPAVPVPAVTPASVPEPAAAAPAAAVAPAAPVILSVLGGGGDWEDAADDWETAAAKADAIVTAQREAEAKAKADAEAAASKKPGSAADGGAGGASAAAGGAAGSAAGAGGASGPAPVLYYPNSKRRIPTAGESAGKGVDDRIRDSRARREARLQLALSSRTDDHLRSPICVVLGHVDTGKTSLLDKIRRTNVQEGEAGGITQQIGATYFPMDRLRTATDKLKAKDLLAGPDKPGSPAGSAAAAAGPVEYKVPGLLIIDTPGHESFVNLRSRGAGLCDIAVLVVDIMHGLERQTIESIQLLKQKKTKFVVALNKIDRMYGWKTLKDAPVRESLAQQPEYAAAEFKTRADRVLMQLAEQGLNAKLYYENDDFRRNVSVVPTSAHTGEGIPDLLALIMQLTQSMMGHKLQFYDHVQATILEVKNIEGLGTTVDIVLVNGELKEGDTIVVCGMDGPIVTQVRALLTPPPLREMRVKSDYVHHKRIEAAMGVKIAAQHLEKAVAGTSLLVAHPDDEIEDLKDEVMEDFDAIMKGFAKDAKGVFVQASTLGSLEALLEYLRTHEPPVPVAQVGIGPLHRKDIVAASIMREHKVEYATILAFDVKVTPEATAAAGELGVTIFSADIIYHLTDMFEKYLKETVEAAQKLHAADAVFPAVCKIIPTAIFNKRDPIVLGVDVIEGKLRLNTPICVVLPEGTTIGGEDGAAGGAGGPAAAPPRKGPVILTLGRVTGIERDHASRDSAEAGSPAVAVKITPEDGAQALMFGRHFDASHLLYSRITRTSIDVLKENFRDQMSKADWKTVIKLKDVLGV